MNAASSGLSTAFSGAPGPARTARASIRSRPPSNRSALVPTRAGSSSVRGTSASWTRWRWHRAMPSSSSTWQKENYPVSSTSAARTFSWRPLQYRLLRAADAHDRPAVRFGTRGVHLDRGRLPSVFESSGAGGYPAAARTALAASPEACTAGHRYPTIGWKTSRSWAMKVTRTSKPR